MFFKWANPGLFLFIFGFSTTNFTEKTVGFSGTRTRIVGLEGEHVDHLTPTTAKFCFKCLAGKSSLVRVMMIHSLTLTHFSSLQDSV